jgi:hypothetical protein
MLWDCLKCGSSFGDYDRAEKHAEKHLVTVNVALDGIDQQRIVAALLHTAKSYDKLAKSRSNAGPERKGIRTGLYNTRNDYRLLAEQIRKAGSS